MRHTGLVLGVLLIPLFRQTLLPSFQVFWTYSQTFVSHSFGKLIDTSSFLRTQIHEENGPTTAAPTIFGKEKMRHTFNWTDWEKQSNYVLWSAGLDSFWLVLTTWMRFYTKEKKDTTSLAECWIGQSEEVQMGNEKGLKYIKPWLKNTEEEVKENNPVTICVSIVWFHWRTHGATSDALR